MREFVFLVWAVLHFLGGLALSLVGLAVNLWAFAFLCIVGFIGFSVAFGFTVVFFKIIFNIH